LKDTTRGTSAAAWAAADTSASSNGIIRIMRA
jgi:hypothetical protein